MRPFFVRLGGGAAEGTRTPDPIITNDVLYQLSYSGARAPLSTRTPEGKGLFSPLRDGVRLVPLGRDRLLGLDDLGLTHRLGPRGGGGSYSVSRF